MIKITRDEVKSFNNENLIASSKYWNECERRVAKVMMWHLEEIQDRELFIEMKYDDMFECLIEHFKYGESTAYSKLAALRIMKEVPSVGEDLASGELLVSNLKMAQSFINAYQKATGEMLTPQEKAEVIEHVKNKMSPGTKTLSKSASEACKRA